MGEWFDLFDGKATELFAYHFQLVIKARGPNRDIGGLFLHQVHKAAAHGLGIAMPGQHLCRW